MENTKLLSALNYLSVFFAPFIVPVIIYFAVKDPEVKRHAIRALISHVLPFVFGILLLGGMLMTGFLATAEELVAGIWLLLLLGYGLLYVILVIWNIFQAFKVLR